MLEYTLAPVEISQCFRSAKTTTEIMFSEEKKNGDDYEGKTLLYTASFPVTFVKYLFKGKKTVSCQSFREDENLVQRNSVTKIHILNFTIQSLCHNFVLLLFLYVQFDEQVFDFVFPDYLRINPISAFVWIGRRRRGG